MEEIAFLLLLELAKKRTDQLNTVGAGVQEGWVLARVDLEFCGKVQDQKQN